MGEWWENSNKGHCKQFKDIHKYIYISHYHNANITAPHNLER